MWFISVFMSVLSEVFVFVLFISVFMSVFGEVLCEKRGIFFEV